MNHHYSRPKTAKTLLRFNLSHRPTGAVLQCIFRLRHIVSVTSFKKESDVRGVPGLCVWLVWWRQALFYCQRRVLCPVERNNTKNVTLLSNSKSRGPTTWITSDSYLCHHESSQSINTKTPCELDPHVSHLAMSISFSPPDRCKLMIVRVILVKTHTTIENHPTSNSENTPHQ